MENHPRLITLLQQGPRWNSPKHGHKHWLRVVENGCRIAEHTPQVDRTVVELFGLLHDSQRWNEGDDPEHGKRAAEYAESIRELLNITDQQFQLLAHALTNHTAERFNADPTIGACYDADRLDLGRVRIKPNPKYLNTAYGKYLAQQIESPK